MKRTDLQNNSLHKYCELMAQDLNAAGYDQKHFFDDCKDGFEVEWTKESFKSVFRSVAKAMYETTSTAELTTVQIQAVYESIDRRISELSGVRNDWPSDEPPMI